MSPRAFHICVFPFVRQERGVYAALTEKLKGALNIRGCIGEIIAIWDKSRVYASPQTMNQKHLHQHRPAEPSALAEVSDRRSGRAFCFNLESLAGGGSRWRYTLHSMKKLQSLFALLFVACATICDAEPVTIHAYFQDDEKQVRFIYVSDSERITPYLGINLFETPMPLSVQDASDAAIAFMKKKEPSMPAGFGKIKHYIVNGLTLRSFSKESKNLYIGCPFYLVTVQAVTGDKRGFATKLLVLPDKTVLESHIDPRYEAAVKK